jgi:two-component system, chemotaxis family, response regulator Rcp1
VNKTSPPGSQALNVLLVDDNPGDLDLARETLEEGPCPVHVSTALSGQAALDLLQMDGTPADAPGPDLVLLDLNMPGITGREVLQEIRRQRPVQPPLVVVLTSSDAEQDLQDSVRLGADGVLIKPLGGDDWQHLLVRLHSLHTLPARPA